MSTSQDAERTEAHLARIAVVSEGEVPASVDPTAALVVDLLRATQL
jgi:hypothetical protein